MQHLHSVIHNRYSAEENIAGKRENIEQTARDSHWKGAHADQMDDEEPRLARRSSPVNDYFSSCAATSGSTAVPSMRTASSARGSKPKAFRTVGATCVVVVGAETVCDRKDG